jgi:hypothetical protein
MPVTRKAGKNRLDGGMGLSYRQDHGAQYAANSGSQRGRRKRRPRRWVLSHLTRISTKLPRLETVVVFLFPPRPAKLHYENRQN